MARKYLLHAVGNQGTDLLETFVVENEDDLQDVKAQIAEFVTEDFMFSQERGEDED